MSTGLRNPALRRAVFSVCIEIAGPRLSCLVGIFASRILILSQCAIIRGILQGRAHLTSMKAHVSQFTIAEAAQHSQGRLAFATGDEGRDSTIEQ